MSLITQKNEKYLVYLAPGEKLGVFPYEELVKLFRYKIGKGKSPEVYNAMVDDLALLHPDIETTPDYMRNKILLLRQAFVPFYEKQKALKLKDDDDKEPIPKVSNLPSPTKDFAASLADVNHETEVEYLCCFLAQNTSEKNPAWLNVIAPPSSGKSCDLAACSDDEYALMTDEITLSALAAGRPNSDAETTNGVFAQINKRSLVVNDMGSVFGDHPDKIAKFVGTLTTAFGGKYRKSDPTETREYNTEMGVILGMTPQIFIQHIRQINAFGNRFFTLNYFNGDDKIYDDDEYEEELNVNIKCNIAAALKRDWTIPFATGVKQLVKDFARDITHLRSFMFAKSKHGLDGASRLYNQIKNLMRSRARLYHRAEVLEEDLDFIKPLTYNTFPYPQFLFNLMYTDKYGAYKSVNNHEVDEFYKKPLLNGEQCEILRGSGGKAFITGYSKGDKKEAITEPTVDYRIDDKYEPVAKLIINYYMRIGYKYMSLKHEEKWKK